MTVLQHAPVDPHLVHKDHADDVLISNFRAELPTRLSQESIAANDLTAEERKILAYYYVELDPIDDLRCLQDGIMVRRSVPATLPNEVADLEGFEFVRDYYKKINDKLVLQARYMREEHEVVLMNRFVDPHNQISIVSGIKSRKSQIA